MAEGAKAATPGADADDSVVCRQRLYDASREGSIAKVRAALDEGAGVNVRDPWGLTALQSAAVGGYAEVTSLLLERQACVDAVSDAGKTALHIAASSGHASVVASLFKHGADVLFRTTYGSTSLDLAKQQDPRGRCTQLITDELSRRLQEAEDVTADLRRRLTDTDVTRCQLQVQLGIDPEEALAEHAAASTVKLPREKQRAEGGAQAKPLHEFEVGSGYWNFASHKLLEFRRDGEFALGCASIRVPPPGNMDPFSWSGPLVTENVLPEVDQDDEELCTSFYRLGLAVEDSIKRLGRGSAEAAKASDPEGDRYLIEQTGRDMQDWEELVLELRSTAGQWDWSRMEIREVELEGMPTGAGGLAAAFAVAPKGTKGQPVFRQKDIIGPLGGTLRRRTRYEQVFCPPNGKLALHDPNTYQFKLRAKTPELRLETVVIDLATGSSSNRLRHLADARADPLGLRSLLEGAGAAGVFAFHGFEIQQRKYGESMPRPRSRPSSPNHGDGGAAVAAQIEAETEEAAAKQAEDQAAAETAEQAQKQAMAAAVNAQIVEVLVQGWPYAFVVATRDVAAGEQLTVDFGEQHWTSQRAAVARIEAMGRIGRDVVAGVDVEDPRASRCEDPGLTLPKREPMKRPNLEKA